MNAIDKEMRTELKQYLDHVETDPDVRVLVLTGAGNAFCAGGYAKSISRLFEQTPDETRRTLLQSTALIRKIRELEKPVIAAVNGDAVGAGCNLAMICDIRLAAEQARFGEVFVKRGMHPDWGGTFSLTQLAGTAKACDLFFTGRIIDAWEAKSMGIVNRVFPEEEFQTAWMDMAGQIAQGVPELLGLVKKAIYQASRNQSLSIFDYEIKSETGEDKRTWSSA